MPRSDETTNSVLPALPDQKGYRHFGDGKAGEIVAARLQGYYVGGATYVDLACDTNGALSVSATGIIGISLGQNTMSQSVPVTMASDQSAMPIHGSVTASGSVAVTGGIIGTITNSVAVTGTVTATGSVTVSGSVAVTGGIIGTITNSVAVTGTVTATGSVAITGGTIGTITNSVASTVANGANITLGAIADAAWDGASTTTSSVVALLKKIYAGTLTIGGDVAHDGVDAGNPVKYGGKAATAPPAAVSAADRVNAQFDIYGKQVVLSGGLREDRANQQTSVSTTTETVVVTADATYKLDLYGLTLANTSASACKVTVKDGTAGTTRFVFQVPAGDTRGFMVDPSGACKQSAANANWTVTCGTSVSTLEVTALTVRSL